MYNIVLSVVCKVELGTRVSDADTPTDLPDVTAAAAHDHNYFCQSDRSSYGHASEQLQQNLSLNVQPRSSKNMVLVSRSNTVSAFISTDRRVRLNTGIPNKATLHLLFGLLKTRAHRMQYWQGASRSLSRKYRPRITTPQKRGPKHHLPLQNEFVLTLMKLRLNLSNEFLATLFGISVGTCSHILHTWVHFLARELRSMFFLAYKRTH